MGEPEFDIEVAEVLGELSAIGRQEAALAARRAELLHQLTVIAKTGEDSEWVTEAVACALRVPPSTAFGLVLDASELVESFPATFALLQAGEIFERHVRRLLHGVTGLTDPAKTRVEAAVLPRAPQQTAAQFGRSVTRAVARFDTRDAAEQHRDAVAGRYLEFRAGEHGMARLFAWLPAEQAVALQAAVQQIADRDKGADERCADHRRADALVELTLGTQHVRPTVNVTVALSTLLALDEQAAEMDGHGPIPATLARALAIDPSGTLRRLLTDDHGQLLDAGARTYRPSAALARFVRLRDRTCRFPGCARSSDRCELDHIVAWQDGGLTTADNLHALCPRHHHLKHDGGWQISKQPDGTTEWLSPCGHTYHQPPPDPLPLDTTTSPPVAVIKINEPAPF